MDGAARAIDEMARVVRPGGILAIATEYVIAGPPHEETFQPSDFDVLLNRPGLSAVQPTSIARCIRGTSTRPSISYGNPHQTPHMVVRFNDTVFTTACVFFRKAGGVGEVRWVE